MMQIKFQCYRPFGARAEDFLRFLPYLDQLNKFSMPHPIDASYEI